MFAHTVVDDQVVVVVDAVVVDVVACVGVVVGVADVFVDLLFRFSPDVAWCVVLVGWFVCFMMVV